MLLLVACANGPIPDGRVRIHDAEELASKAGFHRLQSGPTDEASLPVAVWVRRAPKSLDRSTSLHIYIEGDGLAWRSRRRYSLDPTPITATGLKLALADPSPATIVYLGRPCQYGFSPSSACRPLFWTTARHGQSVLDTMDRRIDDLIEQLGDPRPLTLIGYSGGGVIAALLAARRSDIQQLVTIAAPLDLDGWTRSAGVSPLVDSISPMDRLEALRTVRQQHFVGRQDTSVPIEATEAFHRALGPDAPSRLTIVEAMDHGSWPKSWATLQRTWQNSTGAPLNGE
jgi:pimeloyl-ACP methyl ester carboxylesterase